MYEKYLLQLEEAGKIRNLKSVPLTATKTMFLISLITWKSTRKSLPVRMSGTFFLPRRTMV